MLIESSKLIEPEVGFQDEFYRYCDVFRSANEPPRRLEELARQAFGARVELVDIPIGNQLAVTFVLESKPVVRKLSLDFFEIILSDLS